MNNFTCSIQILFRRRLKMKKKPINIRIITTVETVKVIRFCGFQNYMKFHIFQWRMKIRFVEPIL